MARIDRTITIKEGESYDVFVDRDDVVSFSTSVVSVPGSAVAGEDFEAIGLSAGGGGPFHGIIKTLNDNHFDGPVFETFSIVGSADITFEGDAPPNGGPPPTFTEHFDINIVVNIDDSEDEVVLQVVPPPTGSIVLQENEKAVALSILKSNNVDYPIVINANILAGGGSDDIIYQESVVIRPGSLSAVYELTARLDKIVEKIETGTISFSASTEGYAVPFSGNRTFDISVKDYLLAESSQSAIEANARKFAEMLSVVEQAFTVAAAGSPPGPIAGAFLTAAGLAGVAVDTSLLVAHLADKLNDAERLSGTDAEAAANLAYAAYKQLYVDGFEQIIHTSFVGGTGLLAAGAIALMFGLPITAAAPVLLALGAGWKAEAIYQEFASRVKPGLSLEFESTYPKSTWTKEWIDERHLIINPEFQKGGPELIDGNESSTINGTNRGEKITAGEGDDLILPGKGSDDVDGGAGFDMAVLSASLRKSVVQTNQGKFEIASEEGFDTFTNVERIQFNDAVLAFDTGAQQAYRMYQAAFARTPDKDGLSYWTKRVDSGLTLDELSSFFMSSAELQALYGQRPSKEVLVAGFYTNVLICSQQTGPFLGRVFRARIPGLGGAEDDEGLEVFRRPEGVHSEARRRWCTRGGYLPEGGDQSGDLL